MKKMMNKQEKLNLKYLIKSLPIELEEVDSSNFPVSPLMETKGIKRINAFWSKRFMVQVFKEENNIRISINRIQVDKDGNWLDGISWDELQHIKKKIGYGDRIAFEVYPKEKDIQNLTNMRHLWILEQDIKIGWTKEKSIKKAT